MSDPLASTCKKIATSIMALTFVAGTMTLSNWGFGPGDIAALAGAGRHVGNWLMAQTRDRNMVEFLKLDIDTILTRRGLVDVVELHKRWDNKITLYRNGQPIHIEHPTDNKSPVIDNMEKFTWFMTLVVAALDAAVGPRAVEIVVKRFFTKLFEDAPDGMEYMLRELVHHIQGWRSCALVRHVLYKANAVWAILADKQEHWPGCIPDADYDELVWLLTWLAAGSSSKFVTPSTDAFSFAIVLYEIGLQQIRAVKSVDAGEEYQHDESTICVVLNTNWCSERMDTSRTEDGKDVRLERTGMQIPLNHMEECMSLWPTDKLFAANLRQLFVDGMESVIEDAMIIEVPGTIDNWSFDYVVRSTKTKQNPPRMEVWQQRAVDAFLPIASTCACRNLCALLEGWDSATKDNLNRYLTINRDGPGLHLGEGPRAQLQAFLLGYYYKLFRQIVDTSKINVQEVYGAWGYTTRFLNAIRKLKRNTKAIMPLNGERNPEVRFPREAILFLVGFLFAGVEPNSSAVAANITNNSTITCATSTIGVLAKLSLVPLVMLGCESRSENAAKLCLLDCDTSFIPASGSGCVQEGFMSSLLGENPEEDEVCTSAQEMLEYFTSNTNMDFTPHIEPDWNNDAQCSLLVYRHRGRLVHSMPFSHVLYAITCKARASRDGVIPSPLNVWQKVLLGAEIPWKSYPIVLRRPEHFHGTRITYDREEEDEFVVIAPFLGMPKAAVCVLAMYQQQARFHGHVDNAAIVTSPEELSAAIEDGTRYLIVI